MSAIKNFMNIGIFAHVDAGKTSITELMLYKSGSIRSLGNVDKGTSVSDSLEIEKERGISVRLSTASFLWEDTNFNIIDTPGHLDFSSEVERSLLALDCAILVISAVEGVQAHTDNIWLALRKLNIPTLIFINKVDRPGADINSVLKEIEQDLTDDIIVMQQVSIESEDNINIASIDLTNSALKEKIIEYDNLLLEKYLDEISISKEEIRNSFRQHIADSKIFPILLGSAKFDIGITELISFLSEYFPNASGDETAEPSGIVYKLEHDQNIGKIASVRLFNGILQNRDNIEIYGSNETSKISQIRKLQGQKFQDIGILKAGDTAALCGLSNVKAGDIIGKPGGRINTEVSLKTPLLTIKVSPENNADYSELVKALQILSDEDPSLQLLWLQDERELHIKVMGLIHIEILKSVLNSRFGINALFGDPTVIYKETPSISGRAYEEYTMPKPCWAVVLFTIEPGEPGSGIEYHSEVSFNKIAARYQKEIERTIPKALNQGIKGWEVTDIKITLVDGEHHNIHSRAGDFAVATPMAIMKGLRDLGTELLEPILEFTIKAPEEFLGRISSALSKIGAEILSHSIVDNKLKLSGFVPLATSMDFSITLASISSGKAKYRTRLAMYRKCNYEVSTEFRGISPLDRAKYILQARKALNA